MTLDFSQKMDLTLFPETERDEVVQNIYCIVNTVLGQVPLMREYGLDMSFMHYPQNVAQTMLVAAISDAVRRNEPRAQIVQVSFDENSDDPEHLYPKVEVTINGQVD